jgi:hypothetical protein
VRSKSIWHVYDTASISLKRQIKQRVRRLLLQLEQLKSTKTAQKHKKIKKTEKWLDAM